MQAANNELATFSYSIAHDLRAPLRAIMGFASRVVEEHSTALNPEGQRLLDVVTSLAAQMARMIDNYLRLSGLTHIGLTRKHLNMNQLLQDAWSVATDGAVHVPELELGLLPEAYGDESLIRQVWTNLLSNAVKFTRTQRLPHVRITGTVLG